MEKSTPASSLIFQTKDLLQKMAVTSNRELGSTNASKISGSLPQPILPRNDFVRSESDQADLVDAIFDSFESTFGNQLFSKATSQEQYINIRTAWNSITSDIPTEIVRLTVLSITHPNEGDKLYEWPPKPHEFRILCLNMKSRLSYLTKPRLSPDDLEVANKKAHDLRIASYRKAISDRPTRVDPV